MEDKSIKEFEALRQDILQKDAQYNGYRKEVLTITWTVLAFALSQAEPFVYLIP